MVCALVNKIDSLAKIQQTNLTCEFVPGVVRAVGVVARADAAVVAVAGGAVGARVVAAPPQLHAAREVHWGQKNNNLMRFVSTPKHFLPYKLHAGQH